MKVSVCIQVAKSGEMRRRRRTEYYSRLISGTSATTTTTSQLSSAMSRTDKDFMTSSTRAGTCSPVSASVSANTPEDELS